MCDTQSLEMTERELAVRLESASAPTLVEALGPRYFAAGHLPRALNLLLEGMVQNAPRLLPNQQAEIVVYCSGPSCANSHIAARKLRELGYQHVRVFTGGKAAWKDAGRAFAPPRAAKAQASSA